jgi:hypothetical protein
MGNQQFILNPISGGYSLNEEITCNDGTGFDLCRSRRCGCTDQGFTDAGLFAV